MIGDRVGELKEGRMPPEVVAASERLSFLTGFQALPSEVEEVMGILDEAFPPLEERRGTQRYKFRAQAVLKLRDERLGLLCRTVFVRDVNAWDAGFITDQPLPNKGSGTLEMRMPDGRTLYIECAVRRCREGLPGWYEGVVHFEREEPEFFLGWH